MISTQSLAAFTPVTGVPPVGTPQPVQPVRAPGSISGEGGQPQRPLDAVPPAPAKPLPRGSLLDLRV